MKSFSVDGIGKEIVSSISGQLDAIGIMYRIFHRVKGSSSLQKKLEKNPLYGMDKKLQDLVGVRVVLYFHDDIEMVRSIVSNMYSERERDTSIDEFKSEEFKAVRYNIVYSLPSEIISGNFDEELKNKIDNTFELQIRTIFSEGWHEVEHDLRYKCKSDWADFDDQSRKLNGVYAALETSEWTMIKIFEELAYAHYKNKDWHAMFRQKLRLRMEDVPLCSGILEVFNDIELAKKFYRVNRCDLIKEMSDRGYCYPMTYSNIVYFINIAFVGDDRISSITPSLMVDEMRTFDVET